ncbi:hypothetical protein GWK47_008712 [Chionoecetes opilio]|uniref:ILCR1 Ig-like domain-containing protein n=1 Tax=Chionoecetes opilio TaxID=41210 RepID=A0A8J4Y4Y6_CHIOP|nr:hypothetical protein GWK47_008712 [Chionoecetes opilio]
MEGRGRKEGRTVLRHNFRIPMNPEWLQRTFTPRRRYRRHQNPLARPHQGVATLSTMDLVLQDFGQEQGKPDEVLEGRFTEGFTSIYAGLEDEGRGGEREWRCVCCDCFDYKLDYQEDKAVLNFTYSVYAGCDAACSAVNVQLYRDTVNGSPQLCRSDNARSLMEAQLIGRDKNITQGPISYSNVDTGCYYMVVKPHVSPVPLHSHYLWAKAAINVTIMANWTTYYSLESNPDERSLTVRWTQSQAYNFKNYSISLHHHPSLRIKCTGHALYPNMSTIAVSGQHTLLKQPIYTFHNLKSGWYCARVTPYDDRCPLDGCPPLSSPPVQLTDPLLRSCQAGEGDGGACGGSGALGLILLVVGCVVGAVVTGITVAWGILRSWPSRTHMWNSATHYSSVPIRPALKTPALAARRQVVLLVWTSQGLHGPDFAPIIAAFKTLLRTYAHCEVYDYLDLASLPEKQQLHLLASPTTWLDSILAQHSIKVILVATEGAWQRQMEWQQCVAGPQKDPQASPHQAHDTMLYPYLLRRLHDQPDLAEDYSRLFHVSYVSPLSLPPPHTLYAESCWQVLRGEPQCGGAG